MIKSDLIYEDEPMDTSEISYGDYDEEGEVHTSDEEAANCLLPTKKNLTHSGKSIFGGLTKESNEAQEIKKLERAKRFAIPVVKKELLAVSEETLSQLHKSLGVDKENEKHYRFNAVHMRGTQDMSTEDVFEYFSTFMPCDIEWINDVSCNVVWVDDLSAARALLNLSKEIKNLDKVRLNADPFEKGFRETNEEMDCCSGDEAVDAREIKAAIPPGCWRIGVPSIKSPAILLRLATRSDRKQKNAEKNSEYYKKYGNPHFGNLPGLVSKSMRREVFKKYRKINNGKTNDGDANGKKNPWGCLAEEWSKLDEPKEDARSRISFKRQNPNYQKDLRLSINVRHKRKLIGATESVSLPSENENEEEREIRVKFPRMKMYADEEEKTEINSRNRMNSLMHVPVMEDLRIKIDKRRRRRRKKEIFVNQKKTNKCWRKCNSREEDEEFNEEEGSSWALEEYHDLRESLEQNKKLKKNLKYTKTQDKSECSESDNASDKIFNGDVGHRSPLQIEIENDEYIENVSDDTLQ